MNQNITAISESVPHPCDLSTLKGRWLWASACCKDLLKRCLPLEIPSQPQQLWGCDALVIAKLMRPIRKLPSQDQALLKTYHRWRESAFKVEGINALQLQALCRSLQIFVESLEAASEENKPKVVAKIKDLQECLEVVWGIESAEAICEMPAGEIRALSISKATNLEAFSNDWRNPIRKRGAAE